MGWRFWGNFMMVIGILLLTIFSLVTFTDKSLGEDQKYDERNYEYIVKIAQAVKTGLIFLGDPQSAFDFSIFTKTGDQAVVAENIPATVEPESAANGNGDDSSGGQDFSLNQEMKSIQERMDKLKNEDWRRTELPTKISDKLKEYSDSSSDLLEQRGFFYEETSAGHALGWRSDLEKVYQINLP